MRPALRSIGALFVALFAICGASAAQSFEVVVDFGTPEGREPHAGLVDGDDGYWYGTTVAGGAAHGTIYRFATGVLQTLFSFSGTDGSYPEAGLLLASDGKLYGTTRYGGSANKGTIFRFDQATGRLTTLHVFTGTNGAEPRGELVEGADGRLYGVTSMGGSSNMGTVFAIAKAGTGFAVLRSFTGTNGRLPYGRLLAAPDGYFYGTTSSGGAASLGTVFRIAATGTLTTLRSFVGTDGSGPRAGLTLGTDGYMYGTTFAGGATSQGTVFRINGAGSFTLLRSLSTSTGTNPVSELTRGSDGRFYGTTMLGGANASGVVFRIDTAGTVTVLRSLGGSDGSRPESPLIEVSSGQFVGATPASGPAGASGTLFQISASGVFSRMYAFSGTPVHPYGTLLEGKDGSLYGTSWRGGAGGLGTIFRLTPGVSFDVLHSFTGMVDGGSPTDGVTQGSDGALYGAAPEGGAVNIGAIFKKNPTGAFTLLASATTANAIGYYPYAAPVQASDGNFYGTMSGGGASSAGTLYKMTPTGVVSLVVTFNLASTGKTPYGRMVLGTDGRLYGTTASGGAGVSGTLFVYDPLARTFNTLHAFSGADGAVPYGGLMQGSDGRLYGTTYRGGTKGYGTIFAFDIGARRLTTLHSFAQTNGAYPYAGLLEARDGRLYGTTSAGGASNVGVVFGIDKSGGGYTVLHTFNGANGAGPRGGLAQASDGYLYGTTSGGGSANNGLIFRISPTSPPPPSAAITVTAPNTAVTWSTASTQTISWTHTMGAGSLVKIDISRDGGASWSPVAGSVPNTSATAGSYSWLVSGPDTTQARIKVTSADGSTADSSDANFTIKTTTTTGSVTVVAPNTAVNWAIGSIQLIKWKHTAGSGSSARIDVSRDGGVTWTQVVASVKNGETGGNYKWTVTGPATTKARIRVSLVGGSASDVGDADFTIANPFVTVTSPNVSTDTWTAGTSATIKWTSNLGNFEKVEIVLSKDGGVTYPVVLFSGTPSDGKQAVTVQSVWRTTTGRVRIKWTKNSTVLDVSNQNFVIR